MNPVGLLIQIGPVTLDTFPLPMNELQRQTGADFAAHDLLGRMRGREFVGEGDDTISIKGCIFPFKLMLDGTRELNMLKGAMKSGAAQFVMRGDGEAMGWYLIETINESHTEIQYNGVGFRIDLEVKMVKATADGAGRGRRTDSGYNLIGSILSLFG